MKHRLIAADSRKLKTIEDESVQLVVTSPPYPMIEMWDQSFGEMDPSIRADLEDGSGMSAFEKMHAILVDVWRECDRVLEKNGFVCINIGDATRTLNGQFQLYSNHTAVVNCFLSMGYSVLPDILWRKPSNAPNKFMGSGMYPAGAYVTYEHEYILIFRKGNKRSFSGKKRELRQESAYFWEERNLWFSDLWEIRGTSQLMSRKVTKRERNASFPLEIPYRLVNMYSVKGDTVLDPFCGMGTTNLACMISERNSVGTDVSGEIIELALENLEAQAETVNAVIDGRVEAHRRFISGLSDEKREKCYKNVPHGFSVKTRQETAIRLRHLSSLERNGNEIVCEYE